MAVKASDWSLVGVVEIRGRQPSDCVRAVGGPSQFGLIHAVYGYWPWSFMFSDPFVDGSCFGVMDMLASSFMNF